MPEPNSSDRVWSTALTSTLKNEGAAYPAEVADIADVCEQTARDRMNYAAEMGFLRRETDGSGRVRFRKPPYIQFDYDLYSEMELAD